ncbi:Spy/CpxP family protein refolding chaperone [Xenorhabdus ehlersii]|uniref:Periplasmic protein negative regulator of cpxR n=1 Tax=Xenorhabdus ehlersii TaxID=290111 RepID=A0A2D0IV22_9GAMM|nr:Spy/CpxP family protein refolding chaperone [Xenorhabdus ehlersii]PHM25738.1 periplasmic protein negative regulator of cpxR [Xenorhabdus ehlersii]RKE93315.1 protein CpxP [Xenorhabdus ehlersii]
MRNIAILALASMVVLRTTGALAKTADTDHIPGINSSAAYPYCMPYGYKRNFNHHRDSQYNYSYIFGGIALTEQQREQMWNLVKKQHQHEQPLIDMRDEHRKLNALLAAEGFDEVEVRSQLEKIAEKNVALGVEIARISNLVYQLLTPEQKALLKNRLKQMNVKLEK